MGEPFWTTFEYRGRTFSVTQVATNAWKVELDGNDVGELHLVGDDLPAEEQRWTIRLPSNDVFGVGASWATHGEALAELVDATDL